MQQKAASLTSADLIPFTGFYLQICLLHVWWITAPPVRLWAKLLPCAQKAKVVIMSFGQRLATLRRELVMECLSSGSREVLLHHALRLCNCRLVVLRACETAGHPSSREMWRWHGEPASSEVTHSPPHHSSLLLCYHDCLQQVELPPATSSSCFLPGRWSEKALSAAPSTWLVGDSAGV